MSELIIPKIDVLSLTLDGFEGPIDLLLSLARDHKIDLTKLSILKLAEQYLEFLDDVIKKDIDIAAEYLVMGAWLAFLKSKLLLPEDKIESSQTAEEMSELLEFQIKRLEGIQKVSKLLLKKHQLGTHFFKRGDPEFFNINNTINYELSLYDLIKTYGKIVTKDNNKSIIIAETKLYSVEDAINRLKKLLKTSDGWLNLLDFIPKNIIDKLEIKSSLASHFVASLELVKEGDISLRQDNFNDKILISSKNK
ncbi:MAG: segregation and condensation protein A [Candidatus Puniceispirillales bacterium]